MYAEIASSVSCCLVNGRHVQSVVAKNEPASQRLRALNDLSKALPTFEGIPGELGAIQSIATTPDFHPGKPVPVGVIVDSFGVVMPHLVGNDIGCGMHLVVLDGVVENDLTASLEHALRYVHFQGGRGIALSGRQRHAILRDGLIGLAENVGGSVGLLSSLSEGNIWADVERSCDFGRFETTSIDPLFEQYGSLADGFAYDAILGSIGGGNHFVEFGVVDRVVDGAFARVCGIAPGSVVLVVHSGSLDFGQAIGSFTGDYLKRNSSAAVDHRVLAKGVNEEAYNRYFNGLGNAANIAFVNRYLIALASVHALSRVLGREIGHSVIYDAPHNIVWQHQDVIRHRKGACPARGPGELEGSPYNWYGEPVILPGSMGDGTWLLKGLGSEAGLKSAAHGAGRRLSRQEARSQGVMPRALRVVGPVDLNSMALKARPDIARDAMDRLLEESPAAYRSIDSVVEPMVEAGLAAAVAKIRPVLTVKA